MIEFSHAYKVYPGPVQALKDVNLKIDKGEFVFLKGPSGAGKTTLFRLLSAYDRPTSGAVNVLGCDIKKINANEIPNFRRKIGVVYQDFRLLKSKTIFENVALPLEIAGEKEKYIRMRTDQMLDQVGLLHKRADYPEQLSGGEQQRVAIARAIIHHPGILIADEPTGNLDPYLAREIMRLLDKINAQGTTVFVATHDHELAKSIGRRTVEISAGAIVADGASVAVAQPSRGAQ
jgi:cell division transport system ATP-binding protein